MRGWRAEVNDKMLSATDAELERQVGVLKQASESLTALKSQLEKAVVAALAYGPNLWNRHSTPVKDSPVASACARSPKVEYVSFVSRLDSITLWPPLVLACASVPSPRTWG